MSGHKLNNSVASKPKNRFLDHRTVVHEGQICSNTIARNVTNNVYSVAVATVAVVRVAVVVVVIVVAAVVHLC